MNERTKRELQTLVKLSHLDLDQLVTANAMLERLPDEYPGIILTFNPLQIVRGNYHRLVDDHGQATLMGIVFTAVLTIAASYGIVVMSGTVFNTPGAILQSENIVLFVSLCVVVFLSIYAILWLRVAAQALHRIRRPVVSQTA